MWKLIRWCLLSSCHTVSTVSLALAVLGHTPWMASVFPFFHLVKTPKIKHLEIASLRY